MDRHSKISKITKYFAQTESEVRLSSSINYYDINRACENAFIPILRILFQAPQLKNLNIEKENYPAVDLGCQQSKISIQVTSDTSSTKIINSLKKFKEYNLSTQYNRIIFFLLAKKPNYTSKKIDEEADGLNFNKKDDIFALNDVLQLINDESAENINKIYEIATQEFEKNKLSSQIEANFRKFLENSLEKVNQEKLSKKYIPEVFFESTSVKQRARMFSNPQLFANFFVIQMQKINFHGINKYLRQSELEEITLPEEILNISFQSEKNLEKLSLIEDSLQNLLKLLSNFEDIQTGLPEHFTNYNKIMYEIVKYSINMIAVGVKQKIESLLDEIKLMRSKVFILTSPAGRGKTNFLCDFTETFCKGHKIPIIYIPARELDTSIRDCIFEYIKNNCFFSMLLDKFHFFEILERMSQRLNLNSLIIIDGINEVSDKAKFKNAMFDFFNHCRYYAGIKMILTCRTEFYHAYYQYSANETHLEQLTYHVADIQKTLSSSQSARMIEKYLQHFDIKCVLSDNVCGSFSDNPLLLRIFCDVYTNKDIGKVENIYKVKIFQNYIQTIAPAGLEGKPFKSSYMECMLFLAEIMINEKNVNNIGLDKINNNPNYKGVVDTLIINEILLRRDIQTDDDNDPLKHFGQESINFTFDELRDFLIAYYIYANSDSVEKIKACFDNIYETPAHEGVLRFAYLLSRIHSNEKLLLFIEQHYKIEYLYVNCIKDVPPKYIDEFDVYCIEDILQNGTFYSKNVLMRFLFNSCDLNSPLNTSTLTSFFNRATDDEIYGLISEYKKHEERSGHTLLYRLIRYCNNIVEKNLQPLTTCQYILFAQLVACDVQYCHSFRIYIDSFPEIKKEIILYLKNAASQKIKDFAFLLESSEQRLSLNDMLKHIETLTRK